MFLILLIFYVNVFAGYIQGWVIADEDCWTPDYGAGTCMLVEQCQSMMLIIRNIPECDFELVKQQLSCEGRDLTSRLHGLVNLFTRHGLFTSRRDPTNVRYICCPSSGLIKIVGVSPTNSVPSQDVPKNPNLSLLPADHDVSTGTSPPTTDAPNNSNSDLLPDDGGASFDKPLPPPDVSNHPNLALLPRDCGYSLNTNDKITNGQDADLNEFPWMALISYKTKNGPKFDCGGTIINERYILTAAHCLEYIPFPLLSVRVGEYNLDTNEDCVIQNSGIKKCTAGIQDLAIEQVISHPNYNPTTKFDDIGLLRVSKMNLGFENIRPVCLPLGKAKNDVFEYGIVTGWGFADILKGTKSPILQKVNLPIVGFDQCKKAFSTMRGAPPISFKQLCAGGKNNKDSCAGDSGGPLHKADVKDGALCYIQHGVISFGPRICGTDGIPGVYTKVSYYMDWILDQLKE